MICNNPRCFMRKDTVISPLNLAFLLIKSKKKNYKAKFSTNLILKKKSSKIILEGKKPMRKNVVRKTTVLFPIKSTKIILEKIIKKTI